MSTIFDYVNAKEISSYWNLQANNRKPYLGETLFPSKKQIGLDVKWIKGSKGLPITLSISDFDSKAGLRDRIGFDTIHAQMPFFKESMLILERERQELNKVLSSSNEEAKKVILENIYNDKLTLIDGAEATCERMRMQLLSEGKISIIGKKADGTPHTYQYDYGLNSEQKVTSDWTDLVSSDPVSDIENWINKAIERTGNRPTKAICTNKVWSYIRRNKNIANMFKSTGVMATSNNIKQYFINELNLNIFVYDKMYQDFSGSKHTYLKNNVFTLIPEGNLGSTMFGTTPEESDLMNSPVANVQIVNKGIAITTTNKTDPVNVNTKVSMISLPSFEAADDIIIAVVDGSSFYSKKSNK